MVADTAVGDVRGGEGFYHYRQYRRRRAGRATAPSRTCGSLMIDGALPDRAPSGRRSGPRLAAGRRLDAARAGRCCRRIAAAGRARSTGCAPRCSLAAPTSAAARRSTSTPGRAPGRTPCAWRGHPHLLAALHRLPPGSSRSAARPDLGHAANYLCMVTGVEPAAPHWPGPSSST